MVEKSSENSRIAGNAWILTDCPCLGEQLVLIGQSTPSYSPSYYELFEAG